MLTQDLESAKKLEKQDTEGREGKGRRCCLGDGNDSIPAAIAIFHQADLKKRMNRRTATWRNGCFKRMFDHPVRTIPNHHPTKKDVLPKFVVQIILAAKWLVWHFKYVFQAKSEDLCRLFCLYPSSMTKMHMAYRFSRTAQMFATCIVGWVNFSEFEITVCGSCKMSKKIN